MKLTPRERIALRVARLAAPIVFTIVVGFPGILKGMSGFIEVLLVVAVFGIPIAYIVEAIFGLPVFLLARKYQLVNFWSLSFGGAVVAMLPLFVLRLLNSDSTAQTETSSWPAFAVLGACGFAVGLLFWLVAYYRPHNNRLVRTPETTRHVS